VLWRSQEGVGASGAVVSVSVRLLRSAGKADLWQLHAVQTRSPTVLVALATFKLELPDGWERRPPSRLNMCSRCAKLVEVGGRGRCSQGFSSNFRGVLSGVWGAKWGDPLSGLCSCMPAVVVSVLTTHPPTHPHACPRAVGVCGAAVVSVPNRCGEVIPQARPAARAEGRGAA
jgi:hypothetical protein